MESIERKYFNELFDQYYKILIRFVYSFVNDKEVARDIVQDIYLIIWKNILSIDSRQSVKSYLFTMAKHHALNYLKHQQIVSMHGEKVHEMYQPKQSDPEELEQRLEQVKRKLAELPQKQREVVIRCCVEGKMYKEVAAELNISENTVKTHLMRAMRFLRNELKQDLLLLFIFKKWPAKDQSSNKTISLSDPDLSTGL